LRAESSKVIDYCGDGKGYPYGLKGEETPIEGRIIQIADVFSAITIKRVYRKTLHIDEAIIEIIKNKGIQFEPELVDVFVKIIKNKTGEKHR
jgi:HD-GYP domain-containing protein (c-di-GMP phosphodiesterase class II)